MKRIFALLTILMLTLCLTTTAFASNGTRTGEVIGGGSVDTEIGADASRRHGSGTGSGGVDLSNPNATQDYINNELFGGNGGYYPECLYGHHRWQAGVEGKRYCLYPSDRR